MTDTTDSLFARDLAEQTEQDDPVMVLMRAEDARELQEELKRAKIALSFYANAHNWEHDSKGIFFMAGAFDGPTLIEADEGFLARYVLYDEQCVAGERILAAHEPREKAVST